MTIWIGAYIKQIVKGKSKVDGPRHILFCFCDHYEPMWRNATYEDEVRRVKRWHEEYPVLASKFKDADGNSPKHTFFYPEEEYRKEHLDKVEDMCRQGYGEIEIHLHHDDDTPENLTKVVGGFIDTLRNEHGALPTDPATGKPAFAFIHGNWSLCNSRSDGRWCGINEELVLLKELGCYVDMTMPSAPSDTQTKTINSIYYAENKPGQPKSHDTGIKMCAGGEASGDLLMIQGPLMLNWKKRKFGLIPTIENSDIRTSFPPTPNRVDLWVDANIHVEGRPEWIFIKIHTHGTQDTDIDTLLGKPVEEMHQYLTSKYNDGNNYQLHYVSAREMYNVAKAAEAGKQGNPNDYRDFLLGRPSAS